MPFPTHAIPWDPLISQNCCFYFDLKNNKFCRKMKKGGTHEFAVPNSFIFILNFWENLGSRGMGSFYEYYPNLKSSHYCSSRSHYIPRRMRWDRFRPTKSHPIRNPEAKPRTSARPHFITLTQITKF